jgi:hypothetical protein
MEKLNILAQDTNRALKTLKEITEEPFSIIVRDAAIQRFEYSFEIFWNFVRNFSGHEEVAEEIYRRNLDQLELDFLLVPAVLVTQKNEEI